MKPYFKPLASPLAALLSLFTIHSYLFTASAAVPLRFDIETSEARTRYLDAMRGETVDLELPMLSYGRPLSFTNGTPAGVWWQTNGMGNAWWHGPASVTTDGVARASWTPAMDCGADRYALFVGVGDEDRSYRAAFTVRMRGAPGPHPNEISPPVQMLDFAKIAWTNAPWSASSGLTTNDVRAIVGEETIPAEKYGDFGQTYKVEADVELYSATFFNSPYMPSGFSIDRWESVNACLEDPGNLPDYIDDRASRLTNGLASASEVAQLRTDASLVYQLLVGSNVVAEVTNYNSRVHAPSFRLLQLDPDTHEYFTVWAETNGLTRTFNEAKAYTDATSNALDMVKADRAWSKHTSGLGADAPDGVTWISTPQTVISGGYEYERHITTHGEVWVLTSNGMGFGGDTNSYFRVSTPDGETLFSIEKTDEQIIGVQTDGISVSAGTVTLNVGAVTYNGQAPICMAAQSVNGPWADLSEGRPAWISSVATNGVNGAWSFELESTSPAAFFYFMVTQPGATVIKNSAQTDLSGGILVEGTRFYPHKSGSTLTWTTTP